MLDDSGRDITYRGGPSGIVTRFILDHTHTDRAGRKWLRLYSGEWIRLDRAEYRVLNEMTDRVRSLELDTKENTQ